MTSGPKGDLLDFLSSASHQLEFLLNYQNANLLNRVVQYQWETQENREIDDCICNWQAQESNSGASWPSTVYLNEPSAEFLHENQGTTDQLQQQLDHQSNEHRYILNQGQREQQLAWFVPNVDNFYQPRQQNPFNQQHQQLEQHLDGYQQQISTTYYSTDSLLNTQINLASLALDVQQVQNSSPGDYLDQTNTDCAYCRYLAASNQFR